MTSALRAIVPLDLAEVTPAAPATGVPIFEMVSPRTLFVDPSYQRSLSPASIKHIRRIAGGFDWTNFNPPICAFEEVDGETVLKVINGQHTAIAAASNPHVPMIPVMIVEAPVQASQAAAFISHNTNRLPVRAAELYAAAVTAGDEDALTIQQVCQRAGVTLLKNNPGRAYEIGETLAIRGVRALTARRSALRARIVLETLVKAERAPITGHDIKAADLLLNDDEYSAEIDAEGLTAAILSTGGQAEPDAKVFAASHSVPFWKALAIVWFKRRPKARSRTTEAA